MTKIRVLMVATLLALSAGASGFDRWIPEREPGSVRIQPPPTALQIYQDLELQPGATIDFADVTQQQVGALRGYVLVRYQGEPVWIAVYRFAPDGTQWRTVLPVPEGTDQ